LKIVGATMTMFSQRGGFQSMQLQGESLFRNSVVWHLLYLLDPKLTESSSSSFLKLICVFCVGDLLTWR